MIHDGIAKHAALLFLGGGAVQAGGNQDGDIGVRVALADLRRTRLPTGLPVLGRMIFPRFWNISGTMF